MSDEHEEAAKKRRMPDNLKKYLIKMQGGKMYLPAAFRVVWFRDELGDEWGIRTTMVEGGHNAGYATIHAEILDPKGNVKASAHKTESKADFPAGWVEKAEAGAVARALAFLGFGTQFSEDLEDNGYRPAESPQYRAPSRQEVNRGAPPTRQQEKIERNVAAVEAGKPASVAAWDRFKAKCAEARLPLQNGPGIIEVFRDVRGKIHPALVESMEIKDYKKWTADEIDALTSAVDMMHAQAV